MNKAFTLTTLIPNMMVDVENSVILGGTQTLAFPAHDEGTRDTALRYVRSVAAQLIEKFAAEAYSISETDETGESVEVELFDPFGHGEPDEYPAPKPATEHIANEVPRLDEDGLPSGDVRILSDEEAAALWDDEDGKFLRGED